MPLNGYSDFNGNLFPRRIFPGTANTSCHRSVPYSCCRQQCISDPLVPNPNVSMNPFTQTCFSIYYQTCYPLFTVMFLAAVKLFNSILVFTVLPFLLHPHNLVFLTLMNPYLLRLFSFFPFLLHIFYFPFVTSDYF